MTTFSCYILFLRHFIANESLFYNCSTVACSNLSRKKMRKYLHCLHILLYLCAAILQYPIYEGCRIEKNTDSKPTFENIQNMKTLLSAISMAVFSQILSAQIPIGSAANAPRSGDELCRLKISFVDEGDAGRNQVWRLGESNKKSRQERQRKQECRFGFHLKMRFC